MDLWLYHASLFQGESFASWVARLAVSNGLAWDRFWKVLEKRSGKKLLKSLIPKGIRDRKGSQLESVVEVLARGTGQAVGDIEALLAPTRVRIKSASVRSRELLSHRPRQTKTPKPIVTTQYCPRCLLEDTQPFFRREWMYSFCSVCVHHKNFLHTECDSYGSAIVIGRGDEEELHCCVICGYDLRFTDVLRAPVDENFCWFQSSIVMGLMIGEIRHPVAT